jgi:tetratricopeptide (TPR) repeat protein
MLIEQVKDLVSKSSFNGIFELGIAFLEAGNVTMAERILDDALSEEDPPNYLQLSRILRLIGEWEDAIIAMRSWPAAIKKIPGYQMIGDRLKLDSRYLEELLFLGELEQAKDLFTKYFGYSKRNIDSDPHDSFPDVLCIEQKVSNVINQGMDPDILQELREFVMKQLDSHYQDFKKEKIEFQNFNQVIIFVNNFIKFNMLEKADEIAIELLVAVQKLVDDHLDSNIQQRLKRHSTSTVPAWQPEILLKLLERDPTHMLGNVNIVDLISTKMASMVSTADKKSQELHYRQNFYRVYRHLMMIFKKTSNESLVATCKENMQVLRHGMEVKSKRKTPRSLLNKAKQELRSKNYLNAKKHLQEFFNNLPETFKPDSNQIYEILNAVDLLSRS